MKFHKSVRWRITDYSSSFVNKLCITSSARTLLHPPSLNFLDTWSLAKEATWMMRPAKPSVSLVDLVGLVPIDFKSWPFQNMYWCRVLQSFSSSSSWIYSTSLPQSTLMLRNLNVQHSSQGQMWLGHVLFFFSVSCHFSLVKATELRKRKNKSASETSWKKSFAGVHKMLLIDNVYQVY